MQDLKKTPLYEEHKNLNAKMVDFGGWALPVSYSSQIEEHQSVRNQSGMFDVSHMTVSDITGKDTLPFLEQCLANDIKKATTLKGKAIYSCMLNDKGGVIDDLIAYYLDDEHCRLVTNAATNEKDMTWLNQQSENFSVTITEKPELALIAIQGPEALETIKKVFENDENLVGLKRFQGIFLGHSFIGRTGYTGEDGVEVILPSGDAASLWQSLLEAGVKPCGLGARDTLRLEAGLALYGNDLDEEHTPIESGLSWTVALNDNRHFIGKETLLKPARFKMIGLILEDRGILRSHQPVLLEGKKIGETTSGGFSPTLNQSIALARVTLESGIKEGDLLEVEIRRKPVSARVVKYPFV